MKRLLLVGFFCFTTQYIFAAYVLPSEDSSLITSNKKIGVDRNKKILVYCLYNNLSIREYQKLSGKKLSLTKKIEYLLIKHKVLKPGQDDKGLTKLGGLMLGYLLGPIGILIAFLVPKNKELRRWSIIGFGVLILTIFIVLISISIGGFNWN